MMAQMLAAVLDERTGFVTGGAALTVTTGTMQVRREEAECRRRRTSQKQD